MFVDRVKIQVDAGKGGDGCLSFRREKFVPHGGPDGGDGGNGGSVIIEAREGVNNLAALTHRYHWRAESGQAGSGANRYGRGAEDLLLLVPPGTVVIDAAERLRHQGPGPPGRSRHGRRREAVAARETCTSNRRPIAPRGNGPRGKKANRASWCWN